MNRDKTTRVRYSRLEKGRTPKNTLVTVLDNDVVYFGISRCNRKMDVFHKAVGTFIANERADLARDDEQAYRYNQLENTSVNLHDSGLRGSVPVENVRELIEHFRNVDTYCLDVLAPRTVEV